MKNINLNKLNLSNDNFQDELEETILQISELEIDKI